DPKIMDNLPRNLRFFEKGILKRICVESAKNNLSRIEIITTASSIPVEVGEEYIKAFAQLEVMDAAVLDIINREEANAPENLERLLRADVVMVTGRDQMPLATIFGGTEFHHLLLDKYMNENFVISGTSAGAAASSNNMNYQGSSPEAL